MGGVWFVAAVLAAYRLTRILYADKIAERIRAWVGAVETETSIAYPDTFLGNLFSCFWCLSVWVSVLCTIMYLYFPVLLMPFALSAAASLVWEYTNGSSISTDSDTT